MLMTAFHGRAFALRDVVAAVCCSGALLSVVAVAFSGQDGEGGVKRHARSIKDATQLLHIHKAFTVFSNQFDGIWPKPGLINTKGIEPGVGEEDQSLNTTANLYACAIAHQFLMPAMVVSPIERNSNVKVDRDFNLDAYSPLDDTYWDSRFVADLETGSNTSYAHMPIYGKRGSMRWRNRIDSEWILLANRGPRDGKANPKSYTTDPHGFWSGILGFGDGHVEFHRDMTIENLTYDDDDGNEHPDNVFADETGLDLWLAFTKSISADDLVVQFD